MQTHDKFTIFVGLVIHKDSITVAIAKSGRQDVESIGVISNDSTLSEKRGVTLLFQRF